MPVEQREGVLGCGVHGFGGADVEEDAFFHLVRVVDAEFVGEAGATVVGADIVFWVVEGVHQRDHVGGHDAFGVEAVVVCVFGSGFG